MSFRIATRRLRLPPPKCYPCHRSFITLPGSAPQSLVATRILPYPHEPLYDLIADVDSYSSFVPYCSRSRVTQWSLPDSSGRTWPTLADLHVGWGGFNEVFTSRLRCVPGVSVEALSGGSRTDASSIFKTLETLWSLKPLSHHHKPSSTSSCSSSYSSLSLSSSASPLTEVQLTITYQFVNPLYAAVSAAVSDQMASLMIEAFEKQVHKSLRRPS